MQLSRRQQTVLTDMGIPIWGVRATQQPVSRTETMVELDKADAVAVQVRGKLVLVMASAELSGPEKQLLGAMLQAISLDEDSVTCLSAEQLETLPAASLQDKAVLIMGETLAARYLDGHDLSQPNLQQTGSGKRMACYNLADMLQNPMRKAAVWQALKQLKMAF